MKDEKEKWINENYSVFWIYLFRINYLLALSGIIWIGLSLVTEFKYILYPHYMFTNTVIILSFLMMMKIVYSVHKTIFWRKFEFWIYLPTFLSVSANQIHMYQNNADLLLINTISGFILLCIIILINPIVFIKKNKSI